MTARGSSAAPGTGIIRISPVGGEWYAIWDYAEDGVPDSYRGLAGPEEMTRERAIAWALAQPAQGIKVLDGDAVKDVPRP